MGSADALMLELHQQGSPTSNIISGRNHKHPIISTRADASTVVAFPIDVTDCGKSEPKIFAFSYLKKKLWVHTWGFVCDATRLL